MTAPAAVPAGPWLVVAAPTNTAWSGPWGVSFTANLTPDAETGLGKWTLKTFSETIRTGRHMGRGRKILPPMPIPMYKHFTDADLEAIYTYLQSIPPSRIACRILCRLSVLPRAEASGGGPIAIYESNRGSMHGLVLRRASRGTITNHYELQTQCENWPSRELAAVN